MDETLTRSSGAKSARVLDRAAEKRVRSLSLASDLGWLEEISSDPVQLLQDMSERGLLYRVANGRYLIAQHGTFTPEQVASPEFLAAVRLRGHGAFFFSYLSALIAHRLTDVHSTEITAAIPQDSAYRRRSETIGSYTLRTVRLSSTLWPTADEIVNVRAFQGSREFYSRATIERTLIDALSRPERSGGFEHVIECWGRARHAGTDWDRVVKIAGRHGVAMLRRVVFLLGVMGFDAGDAGRLSGRGASVRLDRSRSFEIGDAVDRDVDTGVLINVPGDRLSSWLAGTE